MGLNGPVGCDVVGGRQEGSMMPSPKAMLVTKAIRVQLIIEITEGILASNLKSDHQLPTGDNLQIGTCLFSVSGTVL